MTDQATEIAALWAEVARLKTENEALRAQLAEAEFTRDKPIQAAREVLNGAPTWGDAVNYVISLIDAEKEADTRRGGGRVDLIYRVLEDCRDKMIAAKPTPAKGKTNE